MKNNSMNIVFVCLNLELGGVENNLVLLTREFVQKGHQVTVVWEGDYLEKDIIREGGQIEKIDFYKRNPFVSGKDLAKTLIRLNPDVVHIFAASCCVAMWVARTFYRPWKKDNKPVLLSSVMGLKNSPDESTLTMQIRNWLLTFGVDMTIMTSPAIARYYRWLPVAKNKLCEQLVCGVVLPESLEKIKRRELRGELGLNPEEKVILTIGALEPRKSHDLFIRAAALVCKDKNNTRFLIAGEGEHRDELTQLIQDTGLEGKVKLLGLRRDVSALLSLADICVKPGVLDGFLGITVLEAQSVGTTVVAFDGEDIREAILNGETGLLAKKGDYYDLAAKLNDLLNDPVKSQKLAAQGNELVREKFDIRVVAEGLLSLYDKLFKKNVRSGKRDWNSTD